MATKIRKPTAKKIKTKRLAIFDDRDTAIVESGASGWYLIPDAPVSNVNPHAAKICVGTATDQPQFSSASCKFPFDGMPPCLFGHIMLAFWHNLLGIGILCNKDCEVLFTKEMVIIYDKNNKPFLTGWREPNKAKLWWISLRPDPGASETPKCLLAVITHFSVVEFWLLSAHNCTLAPVLSSSGTTLTTESTVFTSLCPQHYWLSFDLLFCHYFETQTVFWANYKFIESMQNLCLSSQKFGHRDLFNLFSPVSRWRREKNVQTKLECYLHTC